MTTLFRVLWWFDAVIAAGFVFFFVWGLADGTVSAFNIVLWLVILGVLAAVLLGSRALRAAGHSKLGTALLLPLAIPGVLGVIFMLVVLIAQPRWN